VIEIACFCWSIKPVQLAIQGGVLVFIQRLKAEKRST